jgi:hypothetical protein
MLRTCEICSLNEITVDRGCTCRPPEKNHIRTWLHCPSSLDNLHVCYVLTRAIRRVWAFNKSGVDILRDKWSVRSECVEGGRFGPPSLKVAIYSKHIQVTRNVLRPDHGARQVPPRLS